MTTAPDFGLQEAKEAWMKFKEARDRFEEATWDLRIRYANFAYKHSASKNANEFKVNKDMHMQALNPEDFEGDLLFMEKDSIFGVQYHQVPADYFADPDKWEADFLVRKEEEKRIHLRRMIRMENQRLQGSIDRLSESLKPEETLAGKRIKDDESLLEKIKDYLVREVEENGNKAEIEKAVNMVVIVTKASRDDVYTALAYAEGARELIVHGIEVYTPEEYSYYFEQEDDEEVSA